MGCTIICKICGREIHNANPCRKYCDTCKGNSCFTRRELLYAKANSSVRRQKNRAVQDRKSEKRTGKPGKYLTWRSVWKENRGRCYLCGEPCDPEDCTWRNGSFVTGWRYPTLDHMTPIMRGGRHEADNVRLAHKWCNTIKRDHTVEEVLSPEWEMAFHNMPVQNKKRR